jgi:hypothetical protein
VNARVENKPWRPGCDVAHRAYSSRSSHPPSAVAVAAWAHTRVWQNTASGRGRRQRDLQGKIGPAVSCVRVHFSCRGRGVAGAGDGSDGVRAIRSARVPSGSRFALPSVGQSWRPGGCGVALGNEAVRRSVGCKPILGRQTFSTLNDDCVELRLAGPRLDIVCLTARDGHRAKGKTGAAESLPSP